MPVHPGFAEVVDRGGQRHRLRNALGAGLEALRGSAGNLARSIVTVVIMEPPVRNGGIAFSSSERPQGADSGGASILWPENTAKSTSSALTSRGRCGADWQASSTTRAPTDRARATRAATGLTVPRTLDDVREREDAGARADDAGRGVQVQGAGVVDRDESHDGAGPAASSCHGIRLAWCSISVTTISSPGARANRAASVRRRAGTR